MARVSGIGTYLRNVIPRVISEWKDCRFSLIVRSEDVSLFEDLERTRLLICDAKLYSVREQLALWKIIPGDTSLLWSPHFNIPLFYRGRLAVTVHDLTHIATNRRMSARRLYATVMFRAVRRRAVAILTNSDFTARDFVRRIGSPRTLLTTRLGVAPRWFSLSAPPTREPYFLFVGNVKPHKNLSLLLQAFEHVAPEIPHRLVVVGATSGLRLIDGAAIRTAARGGDRITLTGAVSASELEHYIAGCSALVLPSLYEGFGLPALEAMAAGRPVAVSDVASLPEVCGPDACYFNPHSVESIAEALRGLAVCPRDTAHDRRVRQAWARQFDWATCAELTVRALKGALLSPPPSGSEH